MQLLTDRGIHFTTVEYIETPPAADELDTLCTMLGVEPSAIIRTKEARFRELGLSKEEERTRAEWLKLLSENPILIERPIVVIDGQAVVGRPPENIYTIIQG